MSRKLNSSVLGAWTFFAAAHAIDVCGINGLPLTPNSIRILGRFQKLKTLMHDNICLYLDIKRGKHERVMIISEYYSESLANTRNRSLSDDSKKLSLMIFQTLDALSYLHSQGIVHRCLSPKNILFDSQGNVKLFNYGLFHMTEGGSSVSFPIGVPKYMAPEVLSCTPSSQNEQILISGSKCDIWSLGIIILEIVLGVTLWENCSLEEIFKTISAFSKLESGLDVFDSIAKEHNVSEVVDKILPSLKSFIEDCLAVIPDDRPSIDDLLKHPFILDHDLDEKYRSESVQNVFLSAQLRCKNKEVQKSYPVISDHLAQRPMEEVYYLWKLAGGDVEAELRRQELIRAKPSIMTISNLVVEEGEEFGYKKDRAFLLDDSVLQLPLEPLRHRLKDVDPFVYYPLIEYAQNGMTMSPSSNDLQVTASLPIIIKEKDIEYQLHRIILFRRLLEAYPYKRAEIIREAKVDIPPLYRARIWAALLEIEGDIQSQYDGIDKETPTPTDRQIEVDIPRCHQYDELLSSPAGHMKFKRVLKAWVVSHPQYVYWQGLDSLCAAFLYLNFNDEALAYSCLSAFIPKYLHNFFLKDNSPVIQEYLAKFSHLIAYHDPELTNHLDEIGFIPELYAIPWFLTMYTHVFPLHKIFHLWDTLLLGDSSFPLCIGVAILKQLRNNLLSYGFNECILMFSDMPEIDMQKCVQDSVKIFCGTPKSVTYRVHENVQSKSKLKERSPKGEELAMGALPLHELKSELTPRISAEDLLDLMDILPKARSKNRSTNVKMLVVDVRPQEEFSKGALADTINIPFESALTPEGSLLPSELMKFQNWKGKMITIIGSRKNSNAAEFARELVRQGFSRVSTLHGGIEVLRKTGLLTVMMNS